MSKIVVKMVLTLTQEGNITVEGIPDSILMAYGMLEAAKESILVQRISKGKEKRIVPAPPGWVPPTPKGDN